MDGTAVESFHEKPRGDSLNEDMTWVSGGFFVFNKKIFDYIEDGDGTILERAPLVNVAADGEMEAFTHNGFWHPMDTARDKGILEEMWAKNEAPWKVWD